MTSRVIALVRKDLHLHWQAVILVHVGLLAMIAIPFRLKPSAAGVELGLVLNFNFLLSILWSEWFVSREKLKGTFGWLRTLPLTSFELCVSKIAVVGSVTVSAWVTTSLVFLRHQFWPDGWMTWIAIQLSLLIVCLVAVAGRWRFRQKVGQVFAPLVVGALFVPVALLYRRGALNGVLEAWGTPLGKVAVVVVLIAVYFMIAAATVQWVARSETNRFAE